jgi:hypothetical protein
MTVQVVQAIQDRLQMLKDSAAKLDKTLVDKRAKDFLLRPASNSLSDVETVLLPHAIKAPNPAHANMWFEMADFQLGQAEKQLKHAQDMVVKYGADLQVIGG